MEFKIQVDSIQFQRHHTLSVDDVPVGAVLVTTRISDGIEKTQNSAHVYAGKARLSSVMLDLPNSATFDECLQAVRLFLAEEAVDQQATSVSWT
jgi:hypothetical protein